MYTYTNLCTDYRAHGHTNIQKQTYKGTNFKCSSFLARKKKPPNLIGFWERFDISLPWWSCLVGKEREHCPVLSSYLSCLPNDFWDAERIFISVAVCQLHLQALPAKPGRIKTTILEFAWRQKVFF